MPKIINIFLNKANMLSCFSFRIHMKEFLSVYNLLEILNEIVCSRQW